VVASKVQSQFFIYFFLFFTNQRGNQFGCSCTDLAVCTPPDVALPATSACHDHDPRCSAVGQPDPVPGRPPPPPFRPSRPSVSCPRPWSDHESPGLRSPLPFVHPSCLVRATTTGRPPPPPYARCAGLRRILRRRGDEHPPGMRTPFSLSLSLSLSLFLFCYLAICIRIREPILLLINFFFCKKIYWLCMCTVHPCPSTPPTGDAPGLIEWALFSPGLASCHGSRPRSLIPCCRSSEGRYPDSFPHLLHFFSQLLRFSPSASFFFLTSNNTVYLLLAPVQFYIAHSIEVVKNLLILAFSSAVPLILHARLLHGSTCSLNEVVDNLLLECCAGEQNPSNWPSLLPSVSRLGSFRYVVRSSLVCISSPPLYCATKA
jgi:hypothetical protein